MQKPMDILTEFPVRKSKKQKLRFRKAVVPYLESLGYVVQIESGSMGSRNIVAGDPEHADYVVTAHYDTCAELLLPNFITPCSLPGFLGYQLFMVLAMGAAAAIPGAILGYVFRDPGIGYMVFGLLLLTIALLTIAGPANPRCVNDNTSGVITVLEIARELPENQRSRVCFVLFDLEEAGLIGSASYRKAHSKAVEHQINLNLDCVGDGDHILFFLTKKLRKDRERRKILNHCYGYYGHKQILIRKKGFSVYPSDQVNFPYGVGICALHKKAGIYYLGRIHTRRDTVLDQTNVNLLRAALISMITCGAAK